MDTCKHHFLTSGFRKTPYLLQHILRPAAPHPSAGIGNNAVGTELIAPVLYFDERPGMFRRPADGQCLILSVVGHIRHPCAGTGTSLLLLPEIFFQDRRNLFLLIISYDQVNGGILLQFSPAAWT